MIGNSEGRIIKPGSVPHHLDVAQKLLTPKNDTVDG